VWLSCFAIMRELDEDETAAIDLADHPSVQRGSSTDQNSEGLVALAVGRPWC
jgi:hypothetical protein